MAFAIERLEHVLRWWEDNWFFWDAMRRISFGIGRPTQPSAPQQGPVQHWQEFRDYLLHLPENLDDFDGDRFLGSENIQLNQDYQVGPSFSGLPIALAIWTKSSRRMFAISEELQLLLASTSMAGVRWSDVSWPFASFVVLPERPIIDRHGHHIDCILVSHDQPNTPSLLSFRAFDRVFANRWIGRHNRNQLQHLLSGRRWTAALQLANRLRQNSPKPWSLIFHMDVGHSASVLITDSVLPHIAGIKQGAIEECEELNDIARLVVGMCLYLRTLPPSSPYCSERRLAQRLGAPDPRAISNEAQVCTVSSCYQLTREERVMLGLEGDQAERARYELSCHFREGHWRRPPGYGHLPDALKTVHVRPCVVRRDRLREGELPGGTEKVL